jgi:replicative DNA helicase
VGDLLDDYENQALSIREQGAVDGPVIADDSARGLAMRFVDRAHEWMKKRQRYGYPTGLLALENFHLRIYPTQRLVIAGEPNVGKSTAASQMILNVAAHFATIPGTMKVGVVSLEDGSDRWTDRAISNLSGTPLNIIRDGAMSELRDLPRVNKAVETFSQLPLIVREFGSLSIERLCVVVRQMAKEGCAVVVIDYLQLLRSAKAADARQRVGDAISAVMELAIDLKISMWAISALRKLDGRKPTMDDLKETGDIAYAATEIIALAEVERGDSEKASEIDLHILKQKDGPKGVARVWMRGPVFRVEDPTRRHED